MSMKSDLVRREDVMATVERVCKQYNMGFDTNSTKSGWFSADLPKAIMEIPAVDPQRKDGAK